MKDKKVAWWVLGVIALVAGIALAVTNAVTEGPIQQQGEAKANADVRALLSQADTFDELDATQAEGLDFAYTARKGEEAVGYAAKTTVQGYAGPIEVIIGVDPQGALTGITVGGSDFMETEGVGSKTRDEAFTGQFAGKTPPLTLGSDVEAVSGATISSRAVAQGVNQAASALAALTGVGAQGDAAQGQTAAPEQTAAAQADGAHVNASKWGYAGPVLASVSFAEDGTVAALSIGDERFLETEDVGGRVREAAFTQQFVGQKPPFQPTDVDMISGATVSSTAALEAVNAAYAFWQEGR